MHAPPWPRRIREGWSLWTRVYAVALLGTLYLFGESRARLNEVVPVNTVNIGEASKIIGERYAGCAVQLNSTHILQFSGRKMPDTRVLMAESHSSFSIHDRSLMRQELKTFHRSLARHLAVCGLWSSSHSDQIVVFGGGLNKQPPEHYYFGDLLLVNPVTSHVQVLSPDGQDWPRNRTRAAWASVSDNEWVMFGGQGRKESGGDTMVYDDLWKLKLGEGEGGDVSVEWTPLQATGDSIPPARSGHTLVALDKRSLVLFGGCSIPTDTVTDYCEAEWEDHDATSALNDMWILDVVDMAWTRIGNASSSSMSESTDRPSPRSGHSSYSFVDPETKRPMLGVVGGQARYATDGNLVEVILCHDVWWEYDFKSGRWKSRENVIDSVEEGDPVSEALSVEFSMPGWTRFIMFGGRKVFQDGKYERVMTRASSRQMSIPYSYSFITVDGVGRSPTIGHAFPGLFKSQVGSVLAIHPGITDNNAGSYLDNIDKHILSLAQYKSSDNSSVMLYNSMTLDLADREDALILSGAIWDSGGTGMFVGMGDSSHRCNWVGKLYDTGILEKLVTQECGRGNLGPGYIIGASAVTITGSEMIIVGGIWQNQTQWGVLDYRFAPSILSVHIPTGVWTNHTSDIRSSTGDHFIGLHRSAVTEILGDVYAFGGCTDPPRRWDYFSSSSEVWACDASKNIYAISVKKSKWLVIEDDGSDLWPEARCGHSLTAISNVEFALYGGLSRSGIPLGDLWTYHVVTGKWSLVVTGDAEMSAVLPRWNHGALHVDGRLYVVFGRYTLQPSTSTERDSILVNLNDAFYVKPTCKVNEEHVSINDALSPFGEEILSETKMCQSCREDMKSMVKDGAMVCTACPMGTKRGAARSVETGTAVDCNECVSDWCSGNGDCVISQSGGAPACSCNFMFMGSQCDIPILALVALALGAFVFVVAVFRNLHLLLSTRTLAQISSAKVGAEDLLTPLLEEYRVDPSAVRILNTIGAGASAMVYRGTWNGEAVAVKQFFEMPDSSWEDFRNELHIAARLHHPNIVRVWGAYQGYIIMEFCKDGSLSDFISSFNGRGEGPYYSQLYTYLCDIARAMLHLHSRSPPILHRDLKPGNVLISRGQAKVCDFGFSREKQNATMLMTAGQGTPLYTAPEVWERVDGTALTCRFSEKADVFSFAMLAFEGVAQARPFEDFEFSYEITKAIADGARPSLPLTTLSEHPEIFNLIQSCWHHEPTKRPSFSNILLTLEELRANRIGNTMSKKSK